MYLCVTNLESVTWFKSVEPMIETTREFFQQFKEVASSFQFLMLQVSMKACGSLHTSLFSRRNSLFLMSCTKALSWASVLIFLVAFDFCHWFHLLHSGSFHIFIQCFLPFSTLFFLLLVSIAWVGSPIRYPDLSLVTASEYHGCCCWRSGA